MGGGIEDTDNREQNKDKEGGTGCPQDKNGDIRKQKTRTNKDMEQDREGTGGGTRNTKNQEWGEGQMKQDTHQDTPEGTKINNQNTEGEKKTHQGGEQEATPPPLWDTGEDRGGHMDTG